MRLHLNFQSKKKANKIYKYYSIAHAYRDEKGISRKNILFKLGTLTDEEAIQWKYKISLMNSSDISNLVDAATITIKDQKSFLDVAIMSKIYEKLNIGKAFELVSSQNKLMSTKDVMQILTIARCLDPQSNRKTVDWFSNSYLPTIMNIKESKNYNKDRIFRELDSIHQCKPRLEKLFLESSRQNVRDKKEVELYFFDGTTSFFEGNDCTLGTPGKDKTNGYQENTFLICLLTDKYGNPIAWEVAPGNKRDITEFKKIGSRLAKTYEVKNVNFCFDRGIASSSNFEMIDHDLDSKYITGLDRNQIAAIFDLQNFVTKTRHLLLNALSEQNDNNKSKKEKKILEGINNFHKLTGHTFYKELGVIDRKRYVISFNADIFLKEQNTRQLLLDRAIEQLKILNNGLSVSKQDRDDNILEKKIEKILQAPQIKGIINYKIIPIAASTPITNKQHQSYNIQYSVNQERLEQISLCDGVLVYVSNHIESEDGFYKLNAKTIVSHYKNKYVIENAFRHLKSFLDLRPIYVRLEEHVEAHIDICMTAYYINNYIYRCLQAINMSLNEFYQLITNDSMATELECNGKKSQTILKKPEKRLIEALKILGIESLITETELNKYGIRL